VSISSRFLELAFATLAGLGILLLSALYSAGGITLNLFLLAVVAATLALASLLLPRGSGGAVPTFKAPFSLWLLPIVVYAVGAAELLLHGRTGLGFLLVLAVALLVTVFARERPFKKAMVAVAVVAVYLTSLYSLYAPSFGNDTWRDIMWAAQALQRGHVTETTIRQSAYPFPMVPLTYAVGSLISGLNAVWFSVLMGYLYLVQISFLVFLLTRRFVGFDDYRGVLLLLMTPLAVIWSAGYIPQVYSLLLFLTAILAQSMWLQTPLFLAVVFGHAGVATWAVVIGTALLAFSRKRWMALALLIMAAVFVAYVASTSLSSILVNAYNYVVSAVLTFLQGKRNLLAMAPVEAPPTTSLGSLALSVIAVLGLLVVINGRGPTRALALLSGLFLLLAYVGASAFPATDLPRYVGLPSATVLAFLAPLAFKTFEERKGGAWFALLLLAIAVAAFTYSGVFAPRNPYTGNSYSFSLSGLVSYVEAAQSSPISHILGPGRYLTDWRYGLFLAYHYMYFEPLWQAFRVGGVEVWLGGSYGLYVDPAYLKKFRGFVILRRGALDMLGVYAPSAASRIKDANNSVVYAGGDVEIWLIR